MRLPPLLLPGSALLPLPASLSLVCPLCLLDSAQRSVLGKYIALSYAHPIWGSSSPLLWGLLHSSFSLCHSSHFLRQGCTHPAPSPSPGAQLPPSCLFPSGSALCSISCSETSFHPACLLLTLPSRLPLGLFSPRLPFVCSILRAVLPGGRWKDLMAYLRPAHLGRLSFRSCDPFRGLFHAILSSPVSFGSCTLTLLITPVMHEQIPFVLPLSS